MDAALGLLSTHFPSSTDYNNNINATTTSRKSSNSSLNQGSTPGASLPLGPPSLPFQVHIYGRADADSRRALQRKIEQCASEIDPRARDVIVWKEEYKNADIVTKVFNEVDCVVVPSIWEENSPLVIHESLQVESHQKHTH